MRTRWDVCNGKRDGVRRRLHTHALVRDEQGTHRARTVDLSRTGVLVEVTGDCEWARGTCPRSEVDLRMFGVARLADVARIEIDVGWVLLGLRFHRPLGTDDCRRLGLVA